MVDSGAKNMEIAIVRFEKPIEVRGTTTRYSFTTQYRGRVVPCYRACQHILSVTCGICQIDFQYMWACHLLLMRNSKKYEEISRCRETFLLETDVERKTDGSRTGRTGVVMRNAVRGRDHGVIFCGPHDVATALDSTRNERDGGVY